MLRFAFTWKPVSEMNWRVMFNWEFTCDFQVKDRCMCTTEIDVTPFFVLNCTPYQRKSQGDEIQYTKKGTEQEKMVEDLWDGQS